MQVRFVDLGLQFRSIRSEIEQAIGNVIEDSSFVGGKYLESFEKNFSRYIGTKHCIGVGNGTDALFIALKALGIGEGDEVITVANTFIATSEAVTMAGARVKFVDCDSETYNMNVDLLEQAISNKSRAIIAVHLYGQPARMDAIREIANRHNLFVIEDAAQAHGAKYKDSNVGTLGDCACFSFFPGKNLGAYGDGGAVVAEDENLAQKIRMFANHGRKEKYNHEFEGINSRLDGLQAAILDVKLRHLEEWTERRISVARMYNEGLQGVAITPSVMPDVRHVYHLYVIRVKGRDRVRHMLSERGVATGVHYPIPLPFLDAYAYMGHKPDDFPVAYSLKDEILSLPIHGSMSDEQVEYVINQLRDVCKKV